MSLPGIPTESRTVGKLEGYTQGIIYKATRKFLDAGFIYSTQWQQVDLVQREVGLLEAMMTLLQSNLVSSTKLRGIR